MRSGASVFLVFAQFSLTIAGCGLENKRCAVSGTVTFRGEALETGSISFLTTAGPTGGALIRDGKFKLPAEQGLEPGKYKVTISSPKGVGERTPEQIAAGASVPGKEQIPPKYNRETTLSVDVTPGGPNEFDLKLD
jgi:hypothetical protein